jgi:UDP-GlcNAc:undecaprenyl-phosphate GlcNAc-1-phosphate transferase
VAFMVALIVGWVMTYLVRNQAHARGWVEQASNSSRKIHKKPIPRIGGVAIVLGCFAPLVALLVVDSSVGVTYRANPSVIAGLLGGGLLIAALGLYDDFRGAGAIKKFSIQFIVAGGLWALGFRIESLATPLFGDLALGPLSLPITLLWVVGIVNAMNLIDGLDGLAGGVAFFAVATNFVLAFVRGDVLMSLVMASLAGSVLGFLAFNFNPASIFMGDTGSMFLGFILAAISMKTSQKGGTAVAILVPILALGLPIMDTLLAIVRRALQGRPMFSADKEHIHHRLMSRLGLTHRRAVILLYAVSSFFAVVALGLAYANSEQSAMLLAGVALIVVVLMRKLGYMSLRDAQQLPMMRSRNAQLRSLVKESSERLRAASEVTAMWEALQPVAGAIGASRFALKLEHLGPHMSDGLLFEITREAGSALPLDVQIDATNSERRVGQILVSWRDGRAEVNRDEELALETLAEVVGQTAGRLSAAHGERAS